jgi:hypothetical protein
VPALSHPNGWVKQEPGSLSGFWSKSANPPPSNSLTVQQLKQWADSSAVSPAEQFKRESLKDLLIG